MRPVPPPPAAGPPVAALGRDRPAVRARSRQELLGTYLVDINAMFFGMPQALYPFVADRLGGPAVLGLLYAAPSAGSLLATVTSGWSAGSTGTAWPSSWPPAPGGWRSSGSGFAARSGWRWSAWSLAGAADMISGLFRGIIWNQTIPDHLRGRLAGIEMLSYTTGPTLGNLESGVVARFAGVGGSIVWGGVLCVVGTVALAAALPSSAATTARTGWPARSPRTRLGRRAPPDRGRLSRPAPPVHPDRRSGDHRRCQVPARSRRTARATAAR